MIILYFRLPYFPVSNSALFLYSTSVLSFYIDLALTLSIGLSFSPLAIWWPQKGPRGPNLVRDISWKLLGHLKAHWPLAWSFSLVGPRRVHEAKSCLGSNVCCTGLSTDHVMTLHVLWYVFPSGEVDRNLTMGSLTVLLKSNVFIFPNTVRIFNHQDRGPPRCKFAGHNYWKHMFFPI